MNRTIYRFNLGNYDWYFTMSFRNIRVVISAIVLFICLMQSQFIYASKGIISDKNEIIVSNIKELNAAISSAKPGDVIVMKDGVWKDTIIEFKASADSSAPIILRAQTSGNVILNGRSKLIFSKPYLVADGLLFKEGAIEKGSVITFNSDHCRLTNTAIIDYNPEEFEKNYYWIFFSGNHNRMDHCYLKGKNHMNPLIGNDDRGSKYNTVDHNHLKDIPYHDRNGREVMRIFGYGHADEPGEDGAYFTIEYNLFDHAHGEGVEIVSLKSNYNIVRYNTLRGSRGGIVSRRGKNNSIYGNFILGENQEGSTGIRIADKNHRVYNNYICDVDEDGIRLITGEYYEKSLTKSFKPKKKDLPKYIQVRNCLIAHNTVINSSGNGIDIGYNYKNQWPDIQMVLLPENNKIINNIFYNCGKSVVKIAEQDKKPPLDIFTFAPNVFEGNLFYKGDLFLDPVPAGIKKADPKLVMCKDGLYRPSIGSPAIGGGADTDIKDDMDGNPRGIKKDVGAAQLSETKPVQHPLTSDEVGPEWIIKKRNAGEKY